MGWFDRRNNRSFGFDGLVEGWLILRILGWIVNRVRHLFMIALLVVLWFWERLRRRVLDPAHVLPNAVVDHSLGVILAIILFGIGLGLSHSTRVACWLASFGILRWIVTGYFTPSDWLAALNPQPIAQTNQARIYWIYSTPDLMWNPTRDIHVIQHLLGLSHHWLLMIQARESGVRWGIVDVEGKFSEATLVQTIRAQFPSSRVTTEQYAMRRQSESSHAVRAIQFHLEKHFTAPLLNITELKEHDPLISLAQILSELQQGETVELVFALAGKSEEAPYIAERWLLRSIIHPFEVLSRQRTEHAVLGRITGTAHTPRFERGEYRLMQSKATGLLIFGSYWATIHTSDPLRAEILLQVIQSAHQNYADTHFNALVPLPITSGVVDPLARYNLWLHPAKPDHRPATLILAPGEIAALYHLPHEGVKGARVNHRRSRSHASDAVVNPRPGFVIGRTTYQNYDVDAIISDQDLESHASVVGTTGSGKSTVAVQMAAQQIQQGYGMIFIDPHGNAVKRLLRSAIPTNRENELIIYDLSSPTHPAPFNPLAIASGDIAVQAVADVLEHLFEGTEGAARMGTFLRSSIQLLAHYPEATLKDVARVFIEDRFRFELLSKTRDWETLHFWENQFDVLKPGGRAQIYDPIINRIRYFYSDPNLETALCHRYGVDFAELMDANRIVLISLKQPTIARAESRLIGAMLISQIHMAAARRQRPEQPIYLYIDEMQRFVTSAIDEVLQESRKSGIRLISINQHLSQLRGNTGEALLGNVGMAMMFEAGPNDTPMLSKYVRPQFSEDDLRNLNRYEALVTMRVNGQRQPPFHLRTIPPSREPSDADAREAYLRALSAKHHTPLTHADIRKWHAERYHAHYPDPTQDDESSARPELPPETIESSTPKPKSPKAKPVKSDMPPSAPSQSSPDVSKLFNSDES